MKRLLIVFLIILISVSTLACTEEKVNEETVITESVEETSTENKAENIFIYDDLKDEDFNGYAYRIWSSTRENQDLYTFITYGEMTGDVVQDTLYNSTLNVEERFNVDITGVTCGSDEVTASKVKASVNAGEDAFDLIISQDRVIQTGGLAGYYYNLYKAPNFNFEKPWWTSGTAAMSVDNKALFASSYLSFCCLNYARVIVYNKQIADSLGMDDLYDLVRDGTWIFDKMIEYAEIATSDVNGDGKMDEDDVYGFLTGTAEPYALQVAMGIQGYAKDNNDLPYLDFNLERAQTFLEKFETLMQNYAFYDNTPFAPKPFIDQKGLILYTCLIAVYDEIRYSDVVYGFLPTPKFDEEQENYITGITDAYWAIPITAYDNIDVISVITEALSCQNYNNVLPAYFETTLQTKLSDSPDDSEMLNIIKDTLTIDFGFTYQLSLQNLYGETNSGKLASYYARVEKQADKVLSKLLESFNEIG
ncbi:MAG: hypothetical protein ACOX4O_05175 [Eubacteriales bacterium]|jgi:hypothetical protein